MHAKRPENIVRWRIQGTLETKSPLHLGDGRRLKVAERDCNRESVTEPTLEYSAVMTDYEGHPVIPGTSLKGALRAWAEAQQLDQGLIEQVFGSPERAGRVTFHDARMVWPGPEPKDRSARLWSAKRETGVAASVSLDARTRTAKDKLLFHVEYVPEGTRFEVAFSAQGASEDERSLLLCALRHAFQGGPRPVTLGAGGANGWGRMQFEEGSFERFDLAAWLAGEPRSWQDGLRPVPDEEKAAWLKEADEMRPTASATGDGIARFRLELRFDGALLINDPTRSRKAGPNVDPISHAMVRDEKGRAYLPAKSVRGAFRAQARRIWRTFAPGGEGEEAFLKMFGETGWRSALEVDDFLPEEGNQEEEPQELVAIDRFTGGVSGDRKFRAMRLWEPKFSGEFRVRVDRLFGNSGAGGDAGWLWMLLAFTLRDWQEGDGYIGMGRSKGYGAFRARFVPLNEMAELRLLDGVLRRDERAFHSELLGEWERSFDALTGRQSREVA